MNAAYIEMNNVCLLGRLTAEPELRHTANDIAVTSFSIAVDRRFVKQGEERQADFINIVAWRNTAEFVCKYFHKGNRIALTGSIQTRNYEDRDGNKRTAVEVVAENCFFAESANSSRQTEHPGNNLPAPSFASGDANDFEEIAGDDDLPF